MTISSERRGVFKRLFDTVCEKNEVLGEPVFFLDYSPNADLVTLGIYRGGFDPRRDMYPRYFRFTARLSHDYDEVMLKQFEDRRTLEGLIECVEDETLIELGG